MTDLATLVDQAMRAPSFPPVPVVRKPAGRPSGSADPELAERDDRIGDMFCAGFTQAEIAATYDLSKQRVQMILKAKGLGRINGGFFGARVERAEREREAIKRQHEALADWIAGGCKWFVDKPGRNMHLYRVGSDGHWRRKAAA